MLRNKIKKIVALATILMIVFQLTIGLQSVSAEISRIRLEGEVFNLVCNTPDKVVFDKCNDSIYSGGTYLNTYAPMNSPYSLKCEFQIDNEGIYDLDAVTYKNGIETYLSEYEIQVNDITYHKDDLMNKGAIGAPFNALWYDYNLSVYLKKGNNTIVFTPTTGRKAQLDSEPEYLFAIDYVELCQNINATVKTEFESLSDVSSSANNSCSGGSNGLMIKQGQVTEFEIPLKAPVSGKYLFEFSANPNDTTADYESKYIISQKSETLPLKRVSKTEYYYDKYICDVWLNKGENFLTLKVYKRNMDDYCVLYADYYQITLLQPAENFVLEAEDYKSHTFSQSIWIRQGELSNDKMFAYSGDYTANSCFVEYQFDVAKHGIYEIISRNTAFNEDWTTNFIISVNGGNKFYPGNYATSIRNHTEYSESPNLIKEYSLGYFKLIEGKNKIRVYLDKDDPTQFGQYTTFIDCFKFREVTNFDRIVTNDSCGVYENNNDVVIEVQHMPYEDIDKVFSYRITDYYGNQQNGTVTISAGENSGYINLGKINCGWYKVELISNEKIADTVNIAVVNPYSERYEGDTPFAVDFASSLLRNFDEIERETRAAKLAGVKWMRERYAWNSIQNDKSNKPKFDRIKKEIKNFHDNGIKITTILYGLPKWTSEYNLFDIYDFIKTAADETDVDAWEIENEKDGSSNVSADVYSSFYKAASIGNADSENPAKTSFAAMCISPDSYYNRLLMKNDLMHYADFYNYHIHEDLQENELTRINTYDIKSHIDSSENNGDKPFWITEAGTYIQVDNNNNVNANQRVRQAQYCVTSAVESLATGTDKHFWFVWAKYLENGKELGTFDEKLNPQPAYQAFATMSYELGKGEYIGRLNNDEACGYVFNNGNSNVAVLWADNEKIIDLPAHGDTKVTDIMGVSKTVSCNNNAISINVGNNPIYVNLDNVDVNIINEQYDRNYKETQTFSTAEKIVIQQLFENQTGYEAIMGYELPFNTTTQMTVRLNNFNDKTVDVDLFGTLYGYDVVPENKNVTVPAMSYEDVSVLLIPNGTALLGEQLNLVFNCECEGNISSPSASYVIVQGGENVPDYILNASTDASKWNNFCGGVMTKSQSDGGVHFTYDFTNGLRWAFPYFSVDGNISKNYEGISFMAKADMGSSNGGYYNINCETSDGTVYNLGIITGYILKDDWIHVKAVWDDFEIYTNPNNLPGDTKLNPASITKLRIGGNFSQDNVGFIIKNLGYFSAYGEGVDILSAVPSTESVKVQAVNNQRNFGTFQIIAASYDNNGRMTDVSGKQVENKSPLSDYDINIKCDTIGENVKLFVWDDINGLKPIIPSITVK